MASLRFETFSPDGDTETSNSQEAAKQLAKAYRDGHAKGFIQGAEESAREHAEAQDQLRSQLIEALKDGQMTRQEAQASVTKSLFPLIDALVKALAPSLVDIGFPTELSDQLRKALEGRPNTKPVVRCAPDLVAPLEQSLSDWSGSFEVIPDTALTPHQAKIHWDDGFDHIDLDGCMTEIRQCLDRFSQSVAVDQEQEMSDVG